MLPYLSLGLLLFSPIVVDDEVSWDRATAEHLFNRAGFGATTDLLERAVTEGRESVVDRLLSTEDRRVAKYSDPRQTGWRGVRLPLAGASPDERRVVVERTRNDFAAKMEEYEEWWVGELLAGADPLRDRMTLFWHGLIPSSKYTVRFSHEMIDQHQLLRENALGSVRVILKAMARDAAMLRYLDNASNIKGHPNENWARELMELFSLGEGNYTEKDIQEAARAFTGWTKENHEFVVNEHQHDEGRKTVLGWTGRLDGDDVVEIILSRPACARYFATRLLRYLEGVEPSEARIEKYAQALRDTKYVMRPVLRELLLDPEFYRDEVRGARVSGPIDFLVGTARRFGITDVERMILAGGVVLGQQLFAPPNVKGWDGGLSWINTATIVQRGNLAGVLLGRVQVATLLGSARVPNNPKAASGYHAIRKKQDDGWTPQLAIADLIAEQGAGTDAEIARALLDVTLATPVPPELTRALTKRLSAAGHADGTLLDDRADAEIALRESAHWILGLPEAQLH